MTRRLVSTPAAAALAAAVTLALAVPAEAQTRSGRFGGMPFGGGRYGGYYPGSAYGGYVPGSPYGGYYPGAAYGGYYGNYPGTPFGYQTGYLYPGNYGNFPGSYTQTPMTGYVTPGTMNYYPQTGMVQSGVAQAGYTQPFPMTMGAGVTQSSYQPAGNTARLTVRLPADAQLWVENYQSQQTGPTRVLTTPQLQPGQPYHYTLKAQWNENGRPVTQERTADFRAGENVTVDFTQPAQPTSAEPIGTPQPSSTQPAANPPAAPQNPPQSQPQTPPPG